MFKIEKKPKLKLEIYGESFEMDRLKFKEADRMEMQAKSDDHRALTAVRESLESKGLPSHILDDMDVDDVIKLIEYLSPKKK